MSRIESGTHLAAVVMNPSPAMSSRNAWAARVIEERIARAEAVDPMIGPGILIIPAVIALLSFGWFFPAMSLLLGAAPVIGLVLCLMDRFRAPNPTDAWHWR